MTSETTRPRPSTTRGPISMIRCSLGTAIAVFFVVNMAAAAQADVLRTTDGQWWPKRIRSDMQGAEAPSDAVLKKSGRNNLTLSYSDVVLAGRTFRAGEVAEVWSTTACANHAFREAERQQLSRYWREASASFAEAAADLKGAAREIALFQSVTCLAAANDASATFGAAQRLLEAFPKSFFLARVQDTRARILINRRDLEGARRALDAVIRAPDMNARDLYAARLAKVDFFHFRLAGRDKARYATARAEYESIVREIESRRATRIAGRQWLQGKVGVGRCHVFEGDYAKARPYFEQVLRDKRSTRFKPLLAQAYVGRADMQYGVIKKKLAAGSVPDDQIGALTEALIAAALDYVRVARFYVEHAGDDLYAATVGAARVWATQFHLTGERDCALAQRAGRYFSQAHRMLPRGEARRLLGSEIRRLRAKRDEACAVPDAVQPNTSR